jgi:hypothetical protein
MKRKTKPKEGKIGIREEKIIKWFALLDINLCIGLIQRLTTLWASTACYRIALPFLPFFIGCISTPTIVVQIALSEAIRQVQISHLAAKSLFTFTRPWFSPLTKPWSWNCVIQFNDLLIIVMISWVRCIATRSRPKAVQMIVRTVSRPWGSRVFSYLLTRNLCGVVFSVLIITVGVPEDT